jgi:hypothetical protein
MSPKLIADENSKRRILAKKFKAKANTKLLKDPRAPKRPLTGYFRFAVENFTPGTPVMESSKETAQRWKAMSEAEKSVCLGKCELM